MNKKRKRFFFSPSVLEAVILGMMLIVMYMTTNQNEINGTK